MFRFIVLLRPQLLLLVATVATAQIHPGPDTFGLYTDEGGNQQDGSGDIAFNMVIGGISAPSVGGLEIAFAVTYGSIASLFFFGQPPITPASDHAEISVGFTQPILPDFDGNALLGTFVVNLPEAECCEITTGPTDPASIPGRASYLDGEDVENIIPLSFATDGGGQFIDPEGWLTVPLATVNCAVAAESTTWSAVHGMFR